MPLEIAAADAVAHVLDRQHLSADRMPLPPERVTRDAAGLHASVGTTPYLALHARLGGFVRGHLDTALFQKRTLARIRAMRKTFYVLPVDLLPMVYASVGRRAVEHSRRYLVRRGVAPKDYETLSARIVELVAGGRTTVTQLRSDLDTEVDLPTVVNLMCDEGVLLRDRPERGWRDRRTTYVLFDEALPDVDLASEDEDLATAELVRWYLRAFGPASVDDATWWTGVSKARVRAAMDSLGDDVLDVTVEGWPAPMHALAEDEAHLGRQSLREPSLHLLPELDPYVMGYARRERMIADEHRPFAFDASGNATRTILSDGRIIGVWDTTDEPAPRVMLHFFEETDALQRQLALQAAREMALFFHDETGVSVEFVDAVTPLDERTAGSFMSPLGA